MSINTELIMTREKFEACIISGAIGDAWGSSYENETKIDSSRTYHLGQISDERSWSITDDTQLTLATCEALSGKNFSPDVLSAYFVKYHKERKLTGLGASTLKAILELEMGGHWSQVGRVGEYAAGNGAAMRIAPFAFFDKISREDIRNSCRITHRNDEAYTGALTVVLSIKAILNNEWSGDNNLFDILIPQLPDTSVRDRFIEINSAAKHASIHDIAKLGTSGYVVNSVPFAIFAASQITKLGITKMFQAIIEAGGDTDTNASIAGQIAGSLIGLKNIPRELSDRLKSLKEYTWLQEIVDNTKASIN